MKLVHGTMRLDFEFRLNDLPWLPGLELGGNARKSKMGRMGCRKNGEKFSILITGAADDSLEEEEEEEEEVNADVADRDADEDLDDEVTDETLEDEVREEDLWTADEATDEELEVPDEMLVDDEATIDVPNSLNTKGSQIININIILVATTIHIK